MVEPISAQDDHIFSQTEVLPSHEDSDELVKSPLDEVDYDTNDEEGEHQQFLVLAKSLESANIDTPTDPPQPVPEPSPLAQRSGWVKKPLSQWSEESRFTMDPPRSTKKKEIHDFPNLLEIH